MCVRFNAVIWVLLLALAGCAASPEGSSQAGKPPADSIVTASDEPENRRRARVRLELASGYFQKAKPPSRWMKSSKC